MNPACSDVFLTNPWIPAEWVKAHGLTPRGLFAAPVLDETPLSAGVCAFAQSAVRWAAMRPESTVVFATTCDQLRRAFDATESGIEPRLFLFNIPATWQSPTAARVFRAELERLGRFLANRGGRAPSPAELAAIMREHDRQRRLLRDAAPVTAPRPFAEAVARFYWNGDATPLPPGEPVPEGAVPVALIGGPLPAAHRGLVDFIGGAGGRVALNATEAGIRSLLPVLPERDWSGDPLGALVEAYLDHCVDVFQRPNTRLYEWLRAELAARQIRGIVLWSYVGCDLWRAEAESLRESFGLPVLTLDADENPGCTAREAGRLEAFIEVLR